MSKTFERGVALLVLVLIFAALSLVAVFLIYNTFTAGTKKLTKTSETLEIALKKEYENPFEKDTQYVNPFAGYKNPFDSL